MTELPRASSETPLPGEAGPRLMAAIGHILISELPLALRAAYRLRGRPSIALAVLILASVGFFTRVVNSEAMMRRLYPDYHTRQQVAYASQTASAIPFSERWLGPYRGDPTLGLLFQPFMSFAPPLSRAEAVVDGAIRLLRTPFVPPLDAVSPPARAKVMAVVGWLTLALIVAVHALVFVALVGWMAQGSPRPDMREFAGFWRSHYWRVLAVLVIAFIAENATRMPLQGVWSRASQSAVLAIACYVAAAVPVAALMLAPFVVVGQGVGWAPGILEGVRLLGRRWLALVTLFVLYRVGYEVIAVWKALSPWAAYQTYLSLNMPAPLMWTWAGEMCFALLGLWLAYAFLEIAAGPRPAVRSSDSLAA